LWWRGRGFSEGGGGPRRATRSGGGRRGLVAFLALAAQFRRRRPLRVVPSKVQAVVGGSVFGRRGFRHGG
jgi:hypothetical protein